jgi:sialic acid synthase SpsE
MAGHSVMVGQRLIGEGQPCYIVAEVGSNHDGDLATAHALIDAAADAGVDAVKFQTYTGSSLYSRSTPRFDYLGEIGEEPIAQLLDRLALPREWQPGLAERCRERGVDFLSTPFDEDAVEELDALDVPAFKVASFEITDLPFLRVVGSRGRPVVLSTGMADMEEIEEALAALREAGTDEVVLLQCASVYPAPPGTINLRAMDTMRERFGVPVGLSDHTLGIHVAIAAAARGAAVIEKHLTLDRGRPGPDHPFAIEPPELRDLVAQVREVEVALGDGGKAGPTEEEAVEMYANARRSVVSAVAIPKGTPITEEMLTSKRPGFGIKPKHLPDLVGRVARVDIAEDEVLTWNMV